MLPALELGIKVVTGQRCFPGEVSGQHAEEEHAERPYVLRCRHDDALRACDLAHLACRVGDGAADSFDATACPPCHSEVGQLYVPALAVKQEHIFWLDVSMDQTFTVHEVQSQAELLHTPLDHVLRQTSLSKGQREGERREIPVRVLG